MQMSGLWSELRRRNVLRAAVLYAGAAWALAQGIAQLGPLFDTPNWAMRGFVIACVIGFPFWIAFAWFYEFTPQGLKRESEVEADASITRSTGRRLDKAIIAVLIVAVVLLLTNTFTWKKGVGLQGGSASALPAKSIAVLPFENLSNDKTNAYFADGVQDLILTKLANIGDLKVIARTSTAKYASHPEDVKIIAGQLDVATILEGRVQKSGNQVLINVQLIDARSGDHVWAQSYQRTLDNVFGVEGEVAQKVADALNARLTPGETRRLATAMSGNADANDLFLRADYYANRGYLSEDVALYRQAIPLYRQALAVAPDFALARARLSFAESGVVFYGSGEDDLRQLVADGEAQARQALALQPNLVAAWLALGYNAYWGRQDYPAALKAFAQAIKLRPNDADAFAATGFVLRRQGRLDAAIAALQQALVFDPRNYVFASGLPETLMAAGRYADAAPLYQRAIALDPDNVPARLDAAVNIMLGTGDIPRALAAVQGDNPRFWRLRVQALTYQRKYHEALALLASIPDSPDTFNYKDGPKTLWLANLYRLSDDATRARPLYAQALAQSRARLAALDGSVMKQGFVWSNIAAAELGLGQTDAALASIARSQALSAQSGDLYFGPFVAQLNAVLYAQAGRADLAVPRLAAALASSGIGEYYSPVLLWLDPAWDPIRRDPRFQALLQQYAKYKPAAIHDTESASSSAATN